MLPIALSFQILIKCFMVRLIASENDPGKREGIQEVSKIYPGMILIVSVIACDHEVVIFDLGRSEQVFWDLGTQVATVVV